MDERKEERRVEVLIGGEKIVLKTTEDDTYIQRVTRYVDTIMSEVAGRNMSEKLRTVLVAYIIADDYFKSCEALVQQEAEHERYVMDFGRFQEEHQLLLDTMHEMQGELTRTKADLARTQKELNDFIAEFDTKPASSIFSADPRKAAR